MVTVRTYDGVESVLADERFGVPEAESSETVGTVAWLRASVSRFANGPVHARRRARVVAELDRLDPAALRADAGRRASTASPDRLPRHIPMATLAAALGVADPDAAADAVIAVAGGYFPGSGADAERRADAGVARLLKLIHADLPTAVARITVLVQGCDATATLIETARGALAGRTPDAALADVVVHDPPVRAMRRVARTPAQASGQPVATGDLVVLDVAAANRDDAPSLTFGAGLRPCPGVAQAMALAAGVLDAQAGTR